MSSSDPQKPDKDGLGFVRAVIEFFTSFTGMVTAFLTLVTLVLGVALAGTKEVGPPSETPTATPTSENTGTKAPIPTATPIATPTPTATPDDTAWIAQANEYCRQVLSESAAINFANGEPTRRLAQRLRNLDVPSGVRAQVDAAAQRFDSAAQVADSGTDVDGAASTALAVEAGQILSAVGTTDC